MMTPGRDGHERGDGVERADAAFDQAIAAAPRAGDRCRRGVGRGDEGENENERAE